MNEYRLTHLRELESEAVYVLREVAAQFERPVLLFSGGKDSIVLVHLSLKAFFPAKFPFPLLHIDTGHNFLEALDFRDELVRKLEAQLIVGSVQESIDTGRVVEEQGVNASRNVTENKVYLAVLNKNMEEDIESTVNLHDFSSAGSLVAYVLDGPEIEALNEEELSSVSIKETGYEIEGNSFSFTFPKHSLVFLEIEGKKL